MDKEAICSTIGKLLQNVPETQEDPLRLLKAAWDQVFHQQPPAIRSLQKGARLMGDPWPWSMVPWMPDLHKNDLSPSC